MFLNNCSVLENINLCNELNEDEYRINYYIKEECGYNIHLFLVRIFNSENLEKKYETVTNNIAFEFQTTLKKAIERWNIYVVFIFEGEIELGLKYKIEQDTFSVRKFVYDKYNSTDSALVEVIENKLFNIDKKVENAKDSIKCGLNNNDTLISKIKLIDDKWYLFINDDNIETISKKFIGEYDGE